MPDWRQNVKQLLGEDKKCAKTPKGGSEEVADPMYNFFYKKRNNDQFTGITRGVPRKTGLIDFSYQNLNNNFRKTFKPIYLTTLLCTKV